VETLNSKRTATTIIILLATALLIGGVVFVSQQNDPKVNTEKTSSTKTEKPPKANTDKQVDSASQYKAGDYNAAGDYQSPGGSQEIKIRLTLSSDGTITDTSAEGDDKSSDSKFYQSSFIANYKNKIIGKSIDEVKLDRVGASSLTSDGFNNALEDIKNQAKA
jgi:hypothetical protein